MATSTIIISANTRQAEEALKRIQLSLNNLNNASSGITKSFNRIGSAISTGLKVAAVAATAAGVAMTAVAVSSVRAATDMQNLRIRLDALTGSSEAGAAALEVVRAAAEKLPFDLEKIARASASLVTVSKDSADLGKNIQLAADIAAASGLSIEESSSQIQRAFSGGAAAADMFRERGILAAAGFQQGVSYSVEETRKKFEEYGKSIEGVSNRINETMTGALSQLDDQLYKLKVAFGEPISKALGASINLFVEDLAKGSKENINFATTLGQTVALSIADFLDAVALAIDVVKGWYNTFKPLIDILKQTALFIGDVLVRAFGVLQNAIVLAIYPIAKLTDALGLTNGLTSVLDGLQDSAKILATEGLKGLKEAAATALNSVANHTHETRDAMSRYTDAIRDNVKAQKEAVDASKKTPDGPKPFRQPETGPSSETIAAAEKINQRLIALQQKTASTVKQIELDKSADILAINNATDAQLKQAGLTRNQALAKVEQAYTDILKQQNQTRLEQAKQTYDNDVEILDEKLKQQIISQEEYQEQLAILGHEYRMAELDAEEQSFNRREQLRQKELEAVKRSYEKQAEAALEALGYEQSSAEEGDKVKKALAENMKKYEEDKTKFLIDQGVEAFAAFSTQSKKAFEAYKALKIAQAIMDTYASARAAFFSLAGIPVIGPVLGGIAAAAAVATGMAQVQAIRAQTYAGRALGGPVVGGKEYIIGERGAEVFRPSSAGTIIPNDKMGGQPVTVNFNITANDTTGFDELITSRRQLITGIIRDAQLETGRRF